MSKVKLPVHLVNGVWEFILGGAIPVREGTMAEISVDSHLVKDKSFLKSVTKKVVHQCLPEGTTLMVALSVKENIQHAFFHYPNTACSKGVNVMPYDLPSTSTVFVPVILGSPIKKNNDFFGKAGGLWIEATGLGITGLRTSNIIFPEELKLKGAISLNHAFTLLSERFEVHRLSHTGNAYTRFFYKESNNNWYPLERLKNAELDRAENRVLSESWEAVESEIGWCRLTHDKKK